ncbi:MAG: RnfABCDGE type electron transport complex subunit D [Angelakisella sp.]|nr:RnfABCDGE type electron transport complex subunit D [Angelakisella sp.]
MTDRKLLVSAGPHIRSNASTTSIMGDVLIALLPAVVASVLVFGTRALLLEAVCVASSVLFEYLFRRLLKRSNTISDLSAAVTGLLLAFNLPAGFPIWMAILGCFVAIVIVKQLFGGIGCNFANPAITGRIFLLIAFAGQMTTWPTANSYISGIDAVSGATPLALIKEGSIEALPAVKNLLFGIRGGCLGETCAIALLIGFVYLVIRRVITPTIPVVYVATIALMSLILGYDPIYMILTGGVLLGGIFMLTDYATSPATELGKVVFAVGAGIITMLIRNSSGGYPEGVSFAILLMNILCPYIAKLGHKKPFGGVAK